MGRGVAGAILKVMGAPDYQVELISAGWLCATMRTLTFRCPELFTERQMTDGEFLRFWFPDLDNPKRMHQRGYTLMNIDPEEGTFDAYVLIHEPMGPASHWAVNAPIGSKLAVTLLGSKPFSVPSEATGGAVFFADAASFPAVKAFVDSVPEHLPTRVVGLSYRDSDKQIPLVKDIQAHQRVEFIWLPPEFEALDNHLKDSYYRGWSVNIFTEVKITQHLRKFLVKGLDAPKRLVYTHAYWAKGKAMGKQVETA